MNIDDIIQNLIQNFSVDNLISFFHSKSDYFSVIEEEYSIDKLDNDYFHTPFHLGSIIHDQQTRPKLCVFAIKVKKTLSERSSKRKQFELARNILKNEIIYQGGFFVFYDNSGNFRFSLVFTEYKIENNKIKTEFSSFRRYTYFVEIGKPNNTFKQQIIKANFDDFDSIKEAFSLAKVTKEFYDEIALLFTKLVGGERANKGKKDHFKKIIKYPGENETEIKDFTVRLIGRLLFCWFLKNKKSSNNIPLISNDILSSKKVNETQNYYHNVLEPLFFEVLNTENSERKEKFKTEPFNIVPYLNGGLFEPQDKDYYKINEITQNSEYINTLVVPDKWLLKILELFERYNFTIDESSPYDVELSIDPEMLGMIFENLLAEINPETGETARKATGSFYTPREIVDFMVEQSLTGYLKDKLAGNPNIDQQILDEKLKDLFNPFSTENPFADIPSASDTIFSALLDLKVLDPACGSGAFTMSFVHKMHIILEKIDPNGKKWLVHLLKNINDATFRKTLENKLQGEKDLIDYSRKLGIIRRTIYGVDIQEIAIEIARLRCFLTLIVDEKIDDSKPNRNILPLPNLDFKFIAADSLVGLNFIYSKSGFYSDTVEKDFKSIVDELFNLKDVFFDADQNKKIELKERYFELMNKLKDLLISGRKIKPDLKLEGLKLTQWNPFESKPTDWFDPEFMFGVRDGFDIVIGNPPYIQLQKDGGRLAKLYQNQNYVTFARTGDIYSLFIERGINLLKHNGILSFITSNKWMRAGYGEKLRDFLATKTAPIQLIDFGGYKVFESATVDTNILITKKSSVETQHAASLHQHQKNISHVETQCIVSLQNTHQFYACTVGSDFNSDTSIADYFEQHKQLMPRMNKSAWIISSDIETKIKEKIEAIGTPLKDWDINIYRGVLTGLNEAFVINGKKKDELIAQDPRSAEIIKPILRGRDIKRYKAEFADLWLINSHNGIKDKGIKRIDVVNDYPAIYNHLKQYEKELIKRQDKGDHWTNLRNCAYLEEFEKEKIVYSEIVREQQFYLDNKKYYPEATSFILTGKDLKYLIALLNTNFITYVFKRFYAGGGLGESGFRYKKAFIEQLPIPKIPHEQQQPFIELVEKILAKKSKVGQSSLIDTDTTAEEREIDHLVYKLYNLTDEEIAIIEKNK
ncbi:MAG: Eco57I restriction-modification methylase domain-containing protein [Ignavibacteria bacterium]|nr:Eco57I restriction-modification methylase domain-containing protein [Ignavibacteria bacterium]